MKTLSLALAGLVAVAGLSPVAAVAQTRTVTTHTVVHSHSGPAFDRHRTRRVCRVYRDHGHRVRTCRTVRY